MTWICPYCGFENEQDDKVARNEPFCLRCKRARTSADAVQKKNDAEINDLLSWISHLDDEIIDLRGMESSLCDQLSTVHLKLNDLLKDKEQFQKEIAKIKETPIFHEKVRIVAEDQKTLFPEGQTS